MRSPEISFSCRVMLRSDLFDMEHGAAVRCGDVDSLTDRGRGKGGVGWVFLR